MASNYSKNDSLVPFLLAFSLLLLADNSTAQWYNHGRDITNQRNAIDEVRINSRSVKQLTLKWKFLAGFDITATPAIADGVVYFPSWNGNIYAVNAENGELIWKQNLGNLTGITVPGPNVNVTVSRTTPAVTEDLLIYGINGPVYVVAVKRSTGQLAWLTLLDPDPLRVITCSGTVYKGGLYVGISSLENILLTAETCCTFRGSLVKLDVKTGKLIWQTFTIPDNGGKLGGYSGAGIWGSSPSIDVSRGLVYVGTGQLYTAPPDVLQCQAQQNNQTTPPTTPIQCYSPEAHFDSILAININSGRIMWAKQLGGYDVFQLICTIPNNPDCPPGPNLDADFGEAPMLLSIRVNGTIRDVAVAVQKSGFAWALDRSNGDIIWSTKAGPGSISGGGIWGAATDGKRVYTNIANTGRLNFTLKPSTRNTTAGGWVAMDARTGKILWTTANPSNVTADGPVTIVNGVLFAGSVAPTGPVYAMDARTGAILWSYDTGATVYGGASASYGCIYIGHGNSVSLVGRFYGWTGGKYLFAFCST